MKHKWTENLFEDQELILEIIRLAYLVDNLTPFCVFINYSGHVYNLDIRICTDEDHWQETRCETQFRTKKRSPKVSDLKKKVAILENILENHEIPYEMLECYEHHEPRYYW